MQQTLEQVRLAAATDSTILLLGESGSGKDFVARYLHESSARATGPFFNINCAALPEHLAESELFGHEAGAFTGSRQRKRGLLELAEGGTLLLNEVGELPAVLQAKLLTFLDSKTFTRVGGEKVISTDVRLVAATNRDLGTEVGERKFRRDLYYRLNVFSVRVPPLRERMEDLPILVSELFLRLTEKIGLQPIPDPDAAVMETLARYPWPGNIRELRNVLERALILSQGGPLRPEYFNLDRPVPAEEGQMTVSFPENSPLPTIVAEIESSLIEEALRRCSGNKQAAARMLGITRHSLRRHGKKLGLLDD